MGFRGDTEPLPKPGREAVLWQRSVGRVHSEGDDPGFSIPGHLQQHKLSAAPGSPLPTYRMLFPNMAVHRYGTVLISVPWASMFSAAIRPATEHRDGGAATPGQAPCSALRPQHQHQQSQSTGKQETDAEKTPTATKTKQKAHKDGLRLLPMVHLLLITTTAMSHVPMRLFTPSLCSSDRVESVLSSYPDGDGTDKPLEGRETVGVWSLLQKHIWAWQRCPKAEFGTLVPKPLTQRAGNLSVRLWP